MRTILHGCCSCWTHIAVCNYILLGPTVPTYDVVQERLLCLSTSHTFGPSSTSTRDSSPLVSHSSHPGGHGGGLGHPRCSYYKNWGHVEAESSLSQLMWPKSPLLLQILLSLSPNIMSFSSFEKPTNQHHLL